MKYLYTPLLALAAAVPAAARMLPRTGPAPDYLTASIRRHLRARRDRHATRAVSLRHRPGTAISKDLCHRHRRRCVPPGFAAAPRRPAPNRLRRDKDGYGLRAPSTRRSDGDGMFVAGCWSRRRSPKSVDYVSGFSTTPRATHAPGADHSLALRGRLASRRATGRGLFYVTGASPTGKMEHDVLEHQHRHFTQTDDEHMSWAARSAAGRRCVFPAHASVSFEYLFELRDDNYYVAVERAPRPATKPFCSMARHQSARRQHDSTSTRSGSG